MSEAQGGDGLARGAALADRRLRDSEDLYRYAVELSGQLVWTAAPGGRILSVSRGFTDVTGLGEEVTPHEGWVQVVHPDDRAQLSAAWLAALEARRPDVGEFRMRVADGSYRLFRARAVPRLDEAGAVVRWYGFVEDIEEQARTEAARLNAEERYRLVARATQDAIWDLDLKEGTIQWNESAAETLGYDAPLGVTPTGWWDERVHPDDRDSVVGMFGRAMLRGRTNWSATYRFLRGDGGYSVILDRGFMIHAADGTPLRAVGAMTDITERQHAEQQVRRMQAELIHVSRLSAMGTMASTLAHELNQPLTAVTNYVRGSRRLLDNAADPGLDDARAALKAAEEGALRAGQIVRRLRELVARGTSALRQENLPRLIAEAGVLAFLDAHLQGITHRVEIDPAATWVEVDRIQIQQVLINLIRNAVQAMQDVERREILVSARRAGAAMVEVAVADSGTGIAAEVRDALFSPFQGTKPDGLGIGLSISRTIVEAHGGKIWAESGDIGTIFRFTLPLGEAPGDGADADA